MALSGALTGAGRYKAALPYLEELYQRRPTPRVTYELAQLYWKLGRASEARTLLRQVEASNREVQGPQP